MNELILSQDVDHEARYVRMPLTYQSSIIIKILHYYRSVFISSIIKERFSLSFSQRDQEQLKGSVLRLWYACVRMHEPLLKYHFI